LPTIKSLEQNSDETSPPASAVAIRPVPTNPTRTVSLICCLVQDERAILRIAAGELNLGTT
jgi:hypothetical protein